MKTKRVHILVGLAAASILACASLQARADDTVVLCSGTDGGGYDGIMKGIAAELGKRGTSVQVRNFPGSEDILRELEAGRCSYGPAQKDIHYYLTKQNAGFGSSVTPISVIYNEAMTMSCAGSTGYDELSDLKEGDGVIVGAIGSGSALTWDIMVSIENELGNKSSWAKATPVYTPLDESAAALSLGTAKCAFGVGKVPIQWALDNEANGNTVSWVYDKDLTRLEHGGSQLYPYVRVPYGAYKTKFDTHIVPAVMFRSAKIKVDPEVDRLIKRLTPALGKQKNTVG